MTTILVRLIISFTSNFCQFYTKDKRLLFNSIYSQINSKNMNAFSPSYKLVTLLFKVHWTYTLNRLGTEFVIIKKSNTHDGHVEALSSTPIFFYLHVLIVITSFSFTHRVVKPIKDPLRLFINHTATQSLQVIRKCIKHYGNRPYVCDCIA